MPLLTTLSGVFPAVTASYTGPGDIVSGAFAWYGLRGYNAAYTGHAIRIVDSGGSNATDIDILSGGSLDTATLTTWIGTHGTASVTKVYDQSGNSRDMSNATVAQMPTLNTTGVLSLIAGNGTFPASANVTLSQAFSGSFVANRPVDGSGGVTAFFINGNVGSGFNFQHATPGYIGFGFTLNVHHSGAYTPGTYVPVQYLANGASSAIYYTGSSETVDPGSAGWAGDPLMLWTNNADAIRLTEAGLWSGDKSANFSALETNQKSYWGI